MDERTVHFPSAGLELAGTLYTPGDSGVGGAGIVLCQGYTGTREMFLPILATAFCEAGYRALTFDYRGWGESAGPRHRLFPLEQVEDVRSALSFLAGQPGVDGERLGLWGTSFGGGNAVQAAAEDARVKCVVACLAVGNGRRWLRSLRRLWEWQELLAEIEEDRARRHRGESSRTRSAFEIAPPDPSILELMAAAAQGGVFASDDKSLTLESVQAILDFAPDERVGRIGPRPILFVHAGADRLVSVEEAQALYERAGEPRELLVLPGVNHIDFYLGDALDRVTEASLGWFQKHLPAAAWPAAGNVVAGGVAAAGEGTVATTVGRLNELLRAERAGVAVGALLRASARKGFLHNRLAKVEADEAASCAVLERAIGRLGGVPATGSNDFAEKVAALPTLARRLELLARGQAWVVKRLDALLAEPLAPKTLAELGEMRHEHVANVEWCNQRVAALRAAPPREDDEIDRTDADANESGSRSGRKSD